MQEFPQYLDMAGYLLPKTLHTLVRTFTWSKAPEIGDPQPLADHFITAVVFPIISEFTSTHSWD